jgi:hypothetical protein
MPQLTRLRHPERPDCWQIMYGDVQIGMIAIQPGMPSSAPQWRWDLGFYPPSHQGRSNGGYAPSLEQARTDFETAWRGYLAQCTDADFAEYRRHRAWTQWKYAMRDLGCKLPTQVPELRSRCLCCAAIGFDCEEHVYASHMEPSDDHQHA